MDPTLPLSSIYKTPVAMLWWLYMQSTL